MCIIPCVILKLSIAPCPLTCPESITTQAERLPRGAYSVPADALQWLGAGKALRYLELLRLEMIGEDFREVWHERLAACAPECLLATP